MATDAKRVLTGAPDQLTTGAIWSGPADGFSIPADVFTAAKPAGFDDSGYVSEDGVSLSLERSTTSIKDWSGATVRQLLEEFNGTLTYTHLELSEFSLRETFGDDNVEVLAAATESSGTQRKVSINASDLPRKARFFRMKDGNARVVIVLPDSQVTEIGEVNFIKTDAIKLENTITCYPDAAGNSIYIFLDDGVYTSSATP